MIHSKLDEISFIDIKQEHLSGTRFNSGEHFMGRITIENQEEK